VGWNEPRHAGVTCNAERSLPWAPLLVGEAAVWEPSLPDMGSLPFAHRLNSTTRCHAKFIAYQLVQRSWQLTASPLLQNLFWFTALMGTYEQGSPDSNKQRSLGPKAFPLLQNLILITALMGDEVRA
jgi:hypothetical protein